MYDYGTTIKRMMPFIDRYISPVCFSLDVGIQQEQTQPHHGVAQMSMVQFLQKLITKYQSN